MENFLWFLWRASDVFLPSFRQDNTNCLQLLQILLVPPHLALRVPKTNILLFMVKVLLPSHALTIKLLHSTFSF